MIDWIALEMTAVTMLFVVGTITTVILTSILFAKCEEFMHNCLEEKVKRRQENEQVG